MSSILTNNSAMIALQTLKSVNMNLADTQEMISTGKKVANAKDNSAIFAISKTMESDVQGFKAISESLGLGQSTVAVARQASETITDLLVEMKGRIVAAQEENVDRSAIQSDIDALEAQINSVVGAAQFNGLNLIDGTSSDAMTVLSSLDRDSSGNVTSSSISVDRQNLSVTTPVSAQAFGDTDAANVAAASAIFQGTAADTIADDTAYTVGGNDTESVANNADVTFTVGQVAEGYSYQLILDDVTVNVAGGGQAQAQRTFEYVATATDGTEDVARNLADQINAFFGAATDSANAYTVAQGTGANSNQFTITNGTATTTNATIGMFARVQLDGTAGSSASTGGLGAVQSIDVTSDSGATSALTAIDGLIDQAINAASSFGSDQGRIETQSEFISNLTDSLVSGIGTLVDADLEEASARLQALQVQQQLAIQSLSIANQAPQSILSLFR
ncbi:MAG: flagellin [Pseudomonadota bacterium]